jgi:hypothetical protein
VVLGYGFVLFFAGVVLGALLPPGSLLAGYIAALLSQAGVLALLAYRSANSPALHGLLAVLVAHMLGAAVLYVLGRYVSIAGEPLVLSLIDWGITLLSLVAGVTIGSFLRRRRVGGA